MQRMNKLLLLASVQATLLISIHAKADDEIKTIPPGDDRIVVVKEGDKAPFTVQLFDNNTALRWGNWLEQYRYRLRVDLEVERKKAELDNAGWRERYRLQQEQYTTVTKDLEERLKKAEGALSSPPWYQSPWFGFSAGVLVTGLTVGIASYALHKLSCQPVHRLRDDCLFQGINIDTLFLNLALYLNTRAIGYRPQLLYRQRIKRLDGKELQRLFAQPPAFFPELETC